jgi:phosphate transport system substrate-binding protein
MKGFPAWFGSVRAWRSRLCRLLVFTAAIFGWLALRPTVLRADETGIHPPGKRLLLFVGSNTLGETAIPELAKAYLEQQKKAVSTSTQRNGDLIFVRGNLPDGSPVYIEIHATGSGDCFKSFLNQYPDADIPCDIGMSSRPVTADEAADIKEQTGSDLTERGSMAGDGCEHPVAMDGVAIVVPSSNPVTRISFTELQGIYSRTITDWNQVADWKFTGGSAQGLPILPIRRKEPSGTLDFFKQKIRPDPGPMSDETVIPAFTSSGDLVKKVIDSPGGIGFVGQGYTYLPGLKRLQVFDNSPGMAMTADEAVFPDPNAIRSEYYPLARAVFLYTPAVSGNDDVQPFIQFALSDAGQSVLVGKGGLIGIQGTQYEIVPDQDGIVKSVGPTSKTSDGRTQEIILRLHGSNTIGAECAVNLAINYFMEKRQESNNPTAKIEDQTTPLETPEGESALAHDVMCDVDGDGTLQTIEIMPTGSSDAFRDLHQGLCDIGMASRPITEAERNYLVPICGNLADSDAQFVLGMDALAIIVSPQNKLDQITLEQLRHVFVGDITDWSAIGGDSLPIHIHSRPDRSGTYKYFCDSVLLGRSVPDSATRHPENSEEASAVANDPSGIGFAPMSTTGAAKVLAVGEEGSTTYTLPSEATVQSGQYPPALCRYLYLYVPSTAPHSFTVMSRLNWERAREFAEMSQSWRGQAIVAASGFITATSNTDSAGEARRAKGEPIQDYIERLAKLEQTAQAHPDGLKPKLTDNMVCPRLLFNSDEWTLTPESRNVIDHQLAAWLKMYPVATKSGLIAEGYSDSVGSDEACQELSLRRAQTVASYISETLGVPVTPIGKGKSSQLPNTSEENKQQNRRVVIKLRTASTD